MMDPPVLRIVPPPSHEAVNEFRWSGGLVSRGGVLGQASQRHAGPSRPSAVRRIGANVVPMPVVNKGKSTRESAARQPGTNSARRGAGRQQ